MTINTEFRSPNFDIRKDNISVLVLHYTGMENAQVAIERLCDMDAKVSAHYVVKEDGEIYGLVDEDKRAWHAGVSQWNGKTDINSASIGVEIVNGGHDYGLPGFPSAQIKAVIELSLTIVKAHNIQSWNVVGHSDIAPSRKLDPGEKFPWHTLAKVGLGLWPAGVSDDRRTLFAPGQQDRGVFVLQQGLNFLGYGTEISGAYCAKTQDIVTAFQRRYRAEKIDGIADVQMMEILSSLVQQKSDKEKSPST